MTEKELCWLAGFLEGEGSFMKGPPSNPNLPVISVASTDEDVIVKVANLFVKKYHKASRKEQPRHWKTAFRVALSGERAVKLMKQLHPLMGFRRQKQIEIAISSYNPQSFRLDESAVDAIRKMLSEGRKHKDIAREFGIIRETVTRINTGRTHNAKKE